MTRWLQAARADARHTDKLTELTEPNAGMIRDDNSQPERGFRQFCQFVSTTGNPSSATARADAEALAEHGRRLRLVWDAYAALDDPHNPEAWR